MLFVNGRTRGQSLSDRYYLKDQQITKRDFLDIFITSVHDINVVLEEKKMNSTKKSS